MAEFLADAHVVHSGPPITRRKRSAPRPTHKRPRNKPSDGECSQDAACKNCGSKDLTARSGQYGYYWKCGACDENTAMPAVCSTCGAKKGRDNGVRVRKSKNTYFRDCEECGTSEPIWVED